MNCKHKAQVVLDFWLMVIFDFYSANEDVNLDKEDWINDAILIDESKTNAFQMQSIHMRWHKDPYYMDHIILAISYGPYGMGHLFVLL